MKLLITGANGFIGRNLKEYYQSKYTEVHCPGRAELNLIDSNAVFDYLTKNKFDIVIHCAVTLLSVEHNLQMYFNIERCSSLFGKLICIGSGAEYDMRNYTPMMKESSFGINIPADIYGFSKYVMVKDIEKRKRNIVNLRVFGIYGKYENYKRRFISNNICRALCGLDISINRNMYFDYLYIDDFLKISEMFIERDAPNCSYNVGTGSPISLLELAEIIKDIDGNGLPITVRQEGLNSEYTGDNSLFIAEFGKFRFIDPKDAVAELYDWYRNPSNFTLNKSEFIL